MQVLNSQHLRTSNIILACEKSSLIDWFVLDSIYYRYRCLWDVLDICIDRDPFRNTKSRLIVFFYSYTWFRKVLCEVNARTFTWKFSTKVPNISSVVSRPERYNPPNTKIRFFVLFDECRQIFPKNELVDITFWIRNTTHGWKALGWFNFQPRDVRFGYVRALNTVFYPRLLKFKKKTVMIPKTQL